MKRIALKVNRSDVKELFTGLSMQLFSGIIIFTPCKKDETEEPSPGINTSKYSITKTLSDEAQRNTIAFDAPGFMIENLGSQTYLPPGKVADYIGFQYLRDIDPSGAVLYFQPIPMPEIENTDLFLQIEEEPVRTLIRQQPEYNNPDQIRTAPE